MKAMIFAAGLGTRLKPLTDTMPKALVPVCGRPLIEHVAGRLKDAGITEAVVNVHHFADMLESWVHGQGIMPMQVSDERGCLLDTGGGILNARGALEGTEPFLVHNVDIISDLDIRGFVSSMPSSAMALLAVSDRDSSRRLLFEPDTMRLKGWTNMRTGMVKSPFPGLDPSSCVSRAFSGIHVLSQEVFGVMEEYVSDRMSQHVECPERFPIIDFYLSECHRHEIYGADIGGLRLVDVGKPETLSLVSALMSGVQEQTSE